MRDQKINLKQEVLENASRFEFFEAVRTLCLLTKMPPQSPGNSNLENPNRFYAAATKNFPSGEVQKLEREDGLIKLYTNVIGLFGPTGVLPHHDKDMVAGGEPNLLMRDFLDIFNSRIITLFFKAWMANRQDISLEMHRRGISSPEDSSTLMLLSLCGLGIPQTRNQNQFSDDVFAGSAGLLSRPVRSVSSLRRCVAAQLKVPVEVIEFVEEKIYLPREIQTRLSLDEGGYNRLGKTAIAGESVATHRQRFEVRLGPLSRSQFESLCPYSDAEEESSAMPRNIAFRRLVDLIRSILGRPLDFDIRIEAAPEAVSPAQLGTTRLGFDSWVMSSPSEEKRADTIKRFHWDVSTH